MRLLRDQQLYIDLCRTINKENKLKTKDLEMKILRKMYGLIRLDNIRNKYIRGS